MDEQTRLQKGSPSRDEFKRLHKDIKKNLYACDLDFVLITKEPQPDIVAVLDYKQSGDPITFSEVIAYNALIKRGIPVFIVCGFATQGVFDISKYCGGHHGRPTSRLEHVKRTNNWKEFEEWETSIRLENKKLFQMEQSFNFS